MLSRSPQGEYGLKSRKGDTGFSSGSSLPARGVWIEIFHSAPGSFEQLSLPARGVWIEIQIDGVYTADIVSLPARGVWIEIVYRIMECLLSQSLPARGVWIEIGEKSKSKKEFTVAPRKGSVD